MKCIYCNCTESRVVDSRPTEDGAIRRRRECVGCGRRFTTYEKIETLPLLVIKKDRRREPFDAEKIRSGLVKACEKRPVAIKDIDEMCIRDSLGAGAGDGLLFARPDGVARGRAGGRR